MTKEDEKELLIRTHSMVADLHKCVFGNGRPGLSDRLTIVETRQEGCPARRRNWTGIVGIMIAAGSSLISAVMLIITLWSGK